MSLITNVGQSQYAEKKIDWKEYKKGEGPTVSGYDPTEDESEVRSMIIRHFTNGYTTMYRPRNEFDDMSVIGRMQVDQMSYNTYHPRNTDAFAGEEVDRSWKSNAIRPIVRNKCTSIAAHATADLIFPKLFAFNKASESQNDAADAMSDLMEWAGNQSDYAMTSLQSVLAAMFSPASIVYTEYGDVYRNVKTEKDENGKWKVEEMKDENLSGFKDALIPIDEMFIENIYENDIQKQSWLIWRRVISYDTAVTKYGEYENFKHVKPGVQILYNDSNDTFYERYDEDMRQDMVEEVLYWNRNLDMFHIFANGVLLTEADNPNPRMDKQYPFIKMGYEHINEGNFFYYKSLAFKLESDADIINTLYPMIIDSTYLDIFNPMANYGEDVLDSDIHVPGLVVNLQDPNSRLEPLRGSQNLTGAMNTLGMVEQSLDDSSQDPIRGGQSTEGSQTAYEISRLEQNAATDMGLFLKMIGKFVVDYGELRVSDIIQHLTIPEVSMITDDPELIYKTFLVGNEGKFGSKRVVFDKDAPDEMTENEQVMNSLKLYGDEEKSGQVLKIVNPTLFRELQYKTVISPDIVRPRSKELERRLDLELFDRAIALPFVDQEKLAKDFLLGSHPGLNNPDDYIKAQEMMEAPGMEGGFKAASQPQSPLPQEFPTAV